MNRNYIILLLSSLILVASAILFMSADRSYQVKPELPIMQSFSATPRFEEEQTIFGQTFRMDRYDLKERYERELTNICYTHNTTLLTLKRANRLFPVLVPLLKEEGVPDDFIYLCCIESSLNPRAKSPAGACGLWQFMPETAKQYGLTVNAEIDERYHTVKATKAACKYFKDAYKKFGNWMTVAASYNCGTNGMQRKMSEQQESDPMSLLLAEETSRYMFRLLAYKELFRDPYRYGFVLYSDQLYRPIRTTTITVSTTVTNLTELAKKNGLSYYLLKEFNPWLRDNKITNKTGKQYSLDIPVKEDLYYDPKQPFEVYDNHWVVDKN